MTESFNKVFVSETKNNVYIWVMPVSEFIEGTVDNEQHLAFKNDYEWSYNSACSCYKCSGRDFDNKLEWALHTESAQMFETLEEALKSGACSKITIESIAKAKALSSNHRFKKEIHL